MIAGQNTVAALISLVGILGALTTVPTIAQSESQPPGQAKQLGGLSNTKWVLKSFRDGSNVIMPLKEITLQFEATGRAGGSSGCNSFGGDVDVNSASLKFGPIASTKRACVEEVAMQQEAKYLGALDQARHFELTNGTLTIHYGTANSALVFTKANSTNSGATGSTTPKAKESCH